MAHHQNLFFSHGDSKEIANAHALEEASACLSRDNITGRGSECHITQVCKFGNREEVIGEVGDMKDASKVEVRRLAFDAAHQDFVTHTTDVYLMIIADTHMGLLLAVFC
jgi:uncharacterized protein (DUF1810 family)